jgi:hypothetical protein
MSVLQKMPRQRRKVRVNPPMWRQYVLDFSKELPRAESIDHALKMLNEMKVVMNFIKEVNDETSSR